MPFLDELHDGPGNTAFDIREQTYWVKLGILFPLHIVVLPLVFVDADGLDCLMGMGRQVDNGLSEALRALHEADARLGRTVLVERSAAAARSSVSTRLIDNWECKIQP